MRFRPARALVRDRGVRPAARPDDAGQGHHLGLRPDVGQPGVGAGVATSSPTGSERFGVLRPRLHLHGPPAGAAAAALTNLGIIERDGLVEQARQARRPPAAAAARAFARSPAGRRGTRSGPDRRRGVRRRAVPARRFDPALRVGARVDRREPGERRSSPGRCPTRTRSPSLLRSSSPKRRSTRWSTVTRRALDDVAAELAEARQSARWPRSSGCSSTRSPGWAAGSACTAPTARSAGRGRAPRRGRRSRPGRQGPAVAAPCRAVPVGVLAAPGVDGSRRRARSPGLARSPIGCRCRRPDHRRRHARAAADDGRRRRGPGPVCRRRRDGARHRRASVGAGPDPWHPGGVKMRSGVFAAQPGGGRRSWRRRSCAAAPAARGRCRRGRRSGRRRGPASPSLPRPAPRVPGAGVGLAGPKSSAAPGRRPSSTPLCRARGRRHWRPARCICSGPGSTTAEVLAGWACPARRSASTRSETAAYRRRPDRGGHRRAHGHAPATRLVLGVIGGQGFLLGRGNQQLGAGRARPARPPTGSLSPAADKLARAPPALLRVDAGDESAFERLAGYHRVRTGPARYMMMSGHGGVTPRKFDGKRCVRVAHIRTWRTRWLRCATRCWPRPGYAAVEELFAQIPAAHRMHRAAASSQNSSRLRPPLRAAPDRAAGPERQLRGRA